MALESVWLALQAYKDITNTFVYLVSHPYQLLDAYADPFQNLKRLTVILHDKTSRLSTINKTRREMPLSQESSIGQTVTH